MNISLLLVAGVVAPELVVAAALADYFKDNLMRQMVVMLLQSALAGQEDREGRILEHQGLTVIYRRRWD